MPKSVTEIGSSAFSGCCSLKNIEIPNGVREILDGAFYGCTSLTNVIIPENVTHIWGGPTSGGGAFEDCTALKEVYCKPTTPPSLPKYSSGRCYVFNANASGRKIYVPTESVDAYKKANGWKVYAEDIVGYEF